jgi:glycerophosphoryl diester phosphodiesterase
MQQLSYFTKQPCVLLVILTFFLCPLSAMAKMVIAQGGGSGYLMEHTLPSVALAVAMNSDIIKIDTVLTADNEVIVLGSPNIAKATNVAEIFPDRIRESGKYYALDFTLDEIRRLTLRDPAGRFPKELQPNLRIPTLEEMLALIVALDRGLEKNSRIAVEIKQAWLHRKEGKDLTKPVLTILQKYGYTGQSDKTFLMSYDEKELKRIKKQLLPEMGMSIKLVQLIDSNEGQETMVEEWGEWRSYNYDLMFFKSGLRSLSRNVAAIGLPKYMLVDSEGKLLRNDFVKNAQQLGTMVFTFPVQKDDNMRLPFIHSFDEELEFFYFTVGVDGIITDFCKDALDFLKTRVDKPAVPIDSVQVIPPSIEITAEDPLQLTSPRTLD